MDKIAKTSLLVIDKFGSVTENKYYVKGFFADNEIYVGGFNLKDEYNLKRLVETGLMTCNVESILRDNKNYRTYEGYFNCNLLFSISITLFNQT